MHKQDWLTKRFPVIAFNFDNYTQRRVLINVFLQQVAVFKHINVSRCHATFWINVELKMVGSTFARLTSLHITFSPTFTELFTNSWLMGLIILPP